MQSFTISKSNPTKEDLDNLTEIMNKVQGEIVKYIQGLTQTLNISESCAMDVYYLRTRARHTQEL
jgi:hypothetical protein